MLFRSQHTSSTSAAVSKAPRSSIQIGIEATTEPPPLLRPPRALSAPDPPLPRPRARCPALSFFLSVLSFPWQGARREPGGRYHSRASSRHRRLRVRRPLAPVLPFILYSQVLPPDSIVNWDFSCKHLTIRIVISYYWIYLFLESLFSLAGLISLFCPILCMLT